MRVSLITETYFPQVNGVSRTLGKLVEHLVAAGDMVQLIRPDYGERVLARPDGGDPERGLAEVLTVPALRMPFYRELFLPTPPFGRVRAALDRFRPDIAHIATEATLGLAALNHLQRRSVPVVSSFHTNFDQYSGHYGVGWLNRAIDAYLRYFHNRTLETYVPSQSTIAVLAARGMERLVLWRRGVDAGLFRPDRPGRATVRAACGFAPDDVVIGHVSRLAVEKNIDYLSDALSALHEMRPAARFLIVGDGPARVEAERRLAGFAHFAGYRTGDDLADHYAAADLFAFASTTETFGNVVLEALASALPVVALAAGGVAEVVDDGVCGTLLHAEAAPREFAAALALLVDDHALRRQRAHAARDYALAQTWHEIMSGLRGRYSRILECKSFSNAP